MVISQNAEQTVGPLQMFGNCENGTRNLGYNDRWLYGGPWCDVTVPHVGAVAVVPLSPWHGWVRSSDSYRVWGHWENAWHEKSGNSIGM